MTQQQAQGSRTTSSSAEGNALAQFQRAIAQKSFIDDEVLSLSEKLAQELIRGISGMKKENSITQVRKFYNQVRVVHRKTDPQTLRPRLRVLQAQVAYAVARDILTKEFKEFFDAVIQKIVSSKQEEQALDEFMDFFETLYAYFYYHSKVRE